MASSDHQLALSRSSTLRHHPNVAEKTKGPPAFLQKLFEMLNDPKSTDLIRWSAAGDSFFVLDHERLAREVLPRWFKHQNFSSFVRQLNMYGFHKIPHLQQGVLRSDTDTEFWNFAHPDFIRGHPELLFRIRRKKQNSQIQQQQQQLADEAAAAAVTAAGLVTDGNGNSVVGVSPSGPGSTGPNSSTGLAPLSNNQVLDVHSIIQGIAAIKRHQAAITAELGELKRSNEMLWQDALLAREKLQKQEDMINKIVKFLAGVFGKHAAHGAAGLGNGGGGGAGQGPGGGGGVSHGEANSGNGSASTVQRRNHPANGQQSVRGEGTHDGSSMAVVSRKRARLMIEDGRRQAQSVPPLGGSKSGAEEEEEEDVLMIDNTSPSNKRGSGGNAPLSPISTLSEYHPPSSPSLSSCLDLPETGDDTLSFSTLELSDKDKTAVGGVPTHSRHHSQTHRRRESTEYPEIEMEIETPKSVNSPLPRFASPAESVLGATVNKSSAAVSNLSSERALTHTPPLLYPHQDSNGINNNNNGFHLDPRHMTINLPFSQVQQLLATLANQTISDPNNAGGDGFESGFLVPFDGGSDAGNTHALQQLQSSQHHQPTASTPPFDLSSYLVPSPQLVGMSLVNNSPNAPGGKSTSNTSNDTTTPSNVPMSSTKQNGSGSGSTSSSTTPPASSKSPSKSATPSTAATTPQSNEPLNASTTPFAQSTSSGVPVPDGLIAFDGPDVNSTASTRTAAAAANTAGIASPVAAYPGDMRVPSPFVYPFAGGYQGYPGYPTGPSTTNTTGSTSSSAANAAPTAAQGYPYGYPPYASSNGGWNVSPPGSSSGAGATTTTDFSGLFSPIMSNQKVGFGSPSIPTSSSPPSPSIGMQSPQSHHAYVHYENSNPGGNSNSGAVSAHDSHLASLAGNWRDADDIDRDVGVLDTTIHSLIQTLGLDPSVMDASGAAAAAPVGSSGANGEDGSGADFAVAGRSGTGTFGAPAKGPDTGRKNSQQNLDFETLLSAWGSSPAASGYQQQLGSGSRLAASDGGTSGSSSTPSTAEDLDGTTSVTSGTDEFEDGMTPGTMSMVNSPTVSPAVVGLSGGVAQPIPIPASSRNQSRPNGVVGAPGSVTGTSTSLTTGTGAPSAPNGSPPRPINKKVRTSLTASAATSAGVPTMVEATGTGRKRRSTVITGTAPTVTAGPSSNTVAATATLGTNVVGEMNGVVDGAMVDGMLMNGVGGTVEPAQLVGYEQPGTGSASSQGVQTRSTAKSKKRRG